MNLRKWAAPVATMFLTVLLVSCYPGYQESVDAVDHARDSVRQNNETYTPPPPPVMEKTGAYVDITPVSLSHPPYWLDQSVSIHGSNLPVSFYIEQVLDGTDANIKYGPGVNRGKLISMDYRGTIKGALRQIESKSNYSHAIDNKTGDIEWNSFVTRTFDVSFLPGAAKYEVGGKQGGSAASGSSGSNSNSGSNGVTINYTGVDLSQTDQYSSLTGDISVWKDLGNTVKNLLSKEGRVTVSQATTTITVSDHPTNVAAVGQFIKKMNQELSKQVRILVQVLDVQMNKNYNYGINWDLVRNFGQNALTLTGGLASNAQVGNTFSPLQLIFSSTGGRWNGSNQIIQALTQQGKVSVVTQPTVTTLNNQVAEITIQNQQSYIQSISNSVNQNFASSGVNPGIVTTGFNLYLLPKIQKDKIFLQVSTTISNLQSLQEINANTGEITNNSSSGSSSSSSSTGTTSTSGSSSATPSTSPSIIQIPEIDERRFNQRSVIPNGSTLILAGFKQTTHQANQSSFLYSAVLGGKGGEDLTDELVLLITPVIINDGDTY